jgi:hypothetical protein
MYKDYEIYCKGADERFGIEDLAKMADQGLELIKSKEFTFGGLAYEIYMFGVLSTGESTGE